MKIAKDLLWLFELVAAWVPLHEEKPAAAAGLPSSPLRGYAEAGRRDKAVKRAKRACKADARPLLPGLDFSAES